MIVCINAELSHVHVLAHFVTYVRSNGGSVLLNLKDK